MSIESQALVWAHSQAEGAALLAMLCIADHDGDGGSWPSMETIAQRARVTRETARKLVRRLEAAGELVTDVNGGGGLRTASHMRTNRYEITLDCPPECDRSARHRVSSQPVDNTPPPHGGVPSAGRGAPPPHGGANHPINTLNNQDQSRSGDSRASDRVSDSTIPAPSPAARQKIAEAARLVAEAEGRQPVKRPDLSKPAAGRQSAAPPAPRHPRYDPSSEPRRPEQLPAEQQARNAQAVELRCPEGISPRFRHMMLIAIGDGCAHCGRSTDQILAEEGTP